MDIELLQRAIEEAERKLQKAEDKCNWLRTAISAMEFESEQIKSGAVKYNNKG